MPKPAFTEVITVCQLAFEAEYATDYRDPKVAAKRAVWDTAWEASERATKLIQDESARLDEFHRQLIHGP